MENSSSLAAKLNGICKAQSEAASFSGKGCAFVEGLNSGFLLTIKKLAPQGKVLNIFSERCFAKHGEYYNALIKAASARPFNFIVKPAPTTAEIGEAPCKNIDLVKVASEILNAPEDIRAIVCAEYELIPLCVYCASIRNIPFIYIMRELRTNGLLSPNIYVTNGTVRERLSTDVERIVVLDIDNILLAPDIPSEYVNLTREIISFTDYRVKCAVKEAEPQKAAYNLIRESVMAGYNLMSNEKEKWGEILLFNGLCAQIANFYARGEILDYSSLRITEFYVGGQDRLSASGILELFTRIVGVYYLYFVKATDKVMEVADYLKRAETLSKLTGQNQIAVMDGLNEQISLINQNAAAVKKLRARLKEEIIAHNQSAQIIKNTFFSLGGKSSVSDGGLELIKRCARLSGDFPHTANAMSLVRESGLAELF